MHEKITQSGSTAVSDTEPRIIAANRATHALTLTLSVRLSFQPPPDTICEMALIHLPNVDIGHPKLFIGGEESGAPLSPQPPVNNFVAEMECADLAWINLMVPGYLLERFPRPVIPIGLFYIIVARSSLRGAISAEAAFPG